MSAAWDGYRSQGLRHKRRRRHWAIAATVVLLAGAVLLGVGRCLPQGIFPGTPNRVSAPMAAAEENPAAAAIVIYNENDPLSRDLADFYAQKRGIGPDRVVGLKCPLNDEIDRGEYDVTIANPLRAIFDERKWWTRTKEQPGANPSSTVTANRIRFLVLIRGIPLKISQTASYAGDSPTQPPPMGTCNAASVDSELCTLGMFTHNISGVIQNPYYRSFRRIGEFNNPTLMLAGRLDAPTGSIVRQMIEDSLAVEHGGLWGRCYVDSRGLPPASGGMAEGDAWMRRIATDIVPYALPTILDEQPGLFAAEYPMTDVAMYFGWYSAQPTGVVAREDFRFRRGAVACHLFSFSATSLRDPAQGWVPFLLMKGAAAVLGNVYEPYLTLTTHFDAFAERLVSGMTLAESAYAATPGLSWMNVVVGDPLYRPCLAWTNLEFDLDAATDPESTAAREGRAYLQGAEIWHARGAAAGASSLEHSASRLNSGLIYEGLGLLEAAANDLPRACAAFEAAGRRYKAAPDAIRATLDEAQAFATAGDKARAIRVLEGGRRQYGTEGPAVLFGELEARIGAAATGAKP